MKGRIGCPTQIVTRLPRLYTQAQVREVELSKKAKFRFEVFDWYFFFTGGKNDTTKKDWYHWKTVRSLRKTWNKSGRSFIWTKKPNEILTKIHKAKLC